MSRRKIVSPLWEGIRSVGSILHANGKFPHTSATLDGVTICVNERIGLDDGDWKQHFCFAMRYPTGYLHTSLRRFHIKYMANNDEYRQWYLDEVMAKRPKPPEEEPPPEEESAVYLSLDEVLAMCYEENQRNRKKGPAMILKFPTKEKTDE